MRLKIRNAIMSTFISAASLMVASSAMSADFSQADALYDGRDNVQTFNQALASYKSILNGGGLSGQEVFYAVSQINRLHLFHAELVLRAFRNDTFSASVDISSFRPSNVDRARKEAFNDCLDNAQLIGPNSSLSQVQALYSGDVGVYKSQHYYWRMACNALKMEFLNPIELAAAVPGLISVINEATSQISTGQIVDTTYEGGGLLRSFSGVHANKRARLFGLYDPALASKEAEGALESDAHVADPMGRNGELYFANYRYLAKAILEDPAGDQSEAEELLEDSIELLTEILEELEGGSNVEGITPTSGNIMELTLELDRLKYELAQI